jgi:hypothetical protein
MSGMLEKKGKKEEQIFVCEKLGPGSRAATFGYFM